MKKESYYRWLVLATVSVGTFMATLDGGIVNVALPEISRTLKTDLSTLQWVITGYLLTITSLLPVFGRLADIIGQKKVYSFGFLVFTFGSLLSAFAPNVVYLIIFRIIQAVGASMLMANGVGLITAVFSNQERGKALGLIGTVVAIGSMTGPMVGGILISFFSWTSIFLVNVPIGILGFGIAHFIIKKDNLSKEKEPFDFKGAFYFSTGMVLFLLALSNGDNWGWDSYPIISSTLLALILFTSFIFNSKKAKAPMIDLSLFKNKIFLLGNLANWASFTSLFCVMIIMPFYLDNILGYSPAQIGLMMTPFPLAMALTSPLSGIWSDKIGYLFLTTLGLSINTLGLLSLLFLTENTSFLQIAVRMFVLGFGTGLFQSPNNSSIMGAVPTKKLGTAGSINALIRNLGMVMGVTLSVSIFAAKHKENLGNLIDPTPYLERLAYLEALHFVFLWAAGISFLGIVLTALKAKYKDPKLV